MVDRDMIVRCPGCGNGKVISVALGQLLQCDTCRTSFQAPMTDDGNPDPSAQSESFVIGQPAEPERAGTAGQATARPGTTSSSESNASGSGSSIKNSRSWRTNDLGIAPVSDQSAPASEHASRDSTSESDSSEELDIREPPRWLWTILAMLAVGVILTTIVIAAFLLVQRFTDSGSDQLVASPSRRDMSNAKALWTDASRASQRIDPMTLKIERAIYGTLCAKDLSHQVITTEDDNLMGITVSACNRGRRPRPFQNWYGHMFEDEYGDDKMAELSDDQGRLYALLKFDDVSYIEGQRLADQINPQATVQDTVVFRIPDEIDRSAIKYFRLDLPGAAVGLPDSFRFQIPTSMIEGFSEAAVNAAEDSGSADEFPID